MSSHDIDLPGDDVDLQLAHSIGAAIEAGRLDQLLAESTDPFVLALGEIRQSERQRVAVRPIRKERMWEAIAMNLTANPPVTTPLRLIKSVKPIVQWAVAASLMLLIVVTVLVVSFLKADAPVLVATAGMETRNVVLSDGSAIELRQHSTLYLLPTDNGVRHYQLQGEALFDVAHDPSKPFVLNAGDGVVTVLGTRFVVSTWGAETRVYLAEGSVRLTRAGSHAAEVLAPGQAATVGATGIVTPPEPADEREYLDWQSGSLVFERRAASLVAAELAYHFDITIAIDPSIGDETITGVLSLSEVNTALGSLATVLGGQFQERDEGHYEFVPDI